MEKGSKSSVDKRNEKVYKGAIIGLVLVLGILTVMLITSRQSLKEMTQQKEITSVVNAELQNELDELLLTYNTAKLEFDSVIHSQDSLILAKATEIEQLIRRQADYRRIRRDLERLQTISQEYIRELSELYEINQALNEENIAMRQEIQVVQRRTVELVEDRNVLSEKVELASALRAHQIIADAIRIRGRGREDETDRASRAEQFRVCFNIAENPIAPAGTHNVYMRVAGPDNSILRLSDEDAYSFVHAQDTLQYSSKGTVIYQNTETEMCIYWHRTREFEPGLYLFSLYTDEFKLGETSLSLR